MTSSNSFAALRGANPRKDPEFESDVHASAVLEKRIMATDPASSASRRRLRRRIPRRRFTLIAVTGAIILLGATAAYGGLRFPELANLKPVPMPPPTDSPDFYAKNFRTWQQMHDQYDAWTHKIELPPGATWRGCDPQGREPDANGMTYTFTTGEGALEAVWEGMGHWTIEWSAATKAGDAERAARAKAWVVHLRALLLTGNDEGAAVDQYTAKLLDAAIARAKEGHFEKLSDLTVGATMPYDTPYRDQHTSP